MAKILMIYAMFTSIVLENKNCKLKKSKLSF